MNALTSKTRIVLISLALTILAACGGGGGGDATTNVPTDNNPKGNEPIKVTAITITPQDAKVSKGGESLQLMALIAPDNATNKAVTWTSSNDAIINVSTAGLLTANVDSGNATVTATAQDGSGIKSSITVNAVPKGSIKVTAITISPQNPSVAKGGKTVPLTAVITPTNAANKALAWTSSDTASVSVSSAGVVTAYVDTGSFIITATAQDGSGISGSMTVNAVPPFCTTMTPCLRVTSDAASGDGGSWANPLSGLQAALDQAKILLAQTTSNKPNAVRILLKGGTYRPSKKADGTACVVDTTYSDCSFGMQNNVEIYGGFAGDEINLIDRVLSANTITTLDGLLNPSTTVTACAIGNVNAKCSTSVINNDYTATNPLTASAVLDGVVVRNGRNPVSGGGMYNSNASPTIRNVTFSGNSTGGRGGGMFNNQSSPLLTNVTFSGNTAISGGGIHSFGSSSSLLTNVTFSGNTARLGGGLYNDHLSSPILINVTFSGNTAGDRGGGMYNFNIPLLINVTFLGNNAAASGSKNVINDVGSRPVFVNTVVWGDGIFNYPTASYTTYSSLIQGVVASDTNGNVDGVAATTAGIFGTAVLADNGNPFAQTVAIAANSPALNNGALVWKSGDDYYAAKGNDIFKIRGTGTGKVSALPTGATLISTGGANKNNTVTPTAGSPAIYPDLGAYQH